MKSGNAEKEQEKKGTNVRKIININGKKTDRSQ